MTPAITDRIASLSEDVISSIPLKGSASGRFGESVSDSKAILRPSHRQLSDAQQTVMRAMGTIKPRSDRAAICPFGGSLVSGAGEDLAAQPRNADGRVRAISWLIRREKDKMCAPKFEGPLYLEGGKRQSRT